MPVFWPINARRLERIATALGSGRPFTSSLESVDQGGGMA
jgi:hypothetical protein